MGITVDEEEEEEEETHGKVKVRWGQVGSGQGLDGSWLARWIVGSFGGTLPLWCSSVPKGAAHKKGKGGMREADKASSGGQWLLPWKGWGICLLPYRPLRLALPLPARDAPIHPLVEKSIHFHTEMPLSFSC
ncbi:unnamed protein product [Calypogeia fissa]